ncbi:MAG: DUF3078 domain-containing protein [Salinibacter sp.]
MIHLRVFPLIVAFVALVGGPRAWGQDGDPVPEPNNPEESVPDSSVGTWVYGANAQLNVSQAAYSNWQEGAGNNSLALAAGLGGEAMKRGERWIQAHEVRLAIGILNQENQEPRKSQDEILGKSSLRYEGDDFFRLFNPTMAVNLRTQFARGFDYSSNPFAGQVPEGDPRADLQTPVESSQFFAPAFITESLGLTYEPISAFTLRFGAASKQTVVTVRDFRVLYGVSEDKVARVEAGAEFASSFDRQLTENVRYRSQLDVFFSFNQVKNPPDARWDNTVSLSVNDWLSTDLQFVALFDKDISDALQFKETISVGLSFTLI